MHLNFVFFFFNDTATTEIYTLSLHDALPISRISPPCVWPDSCRPTPWAALSRAVLGWWADRKSTRLNSSHLVISYAVFCLKKKKIKFECCREAVIRSPGVVRLRDVTHADRPY